MVVGHKVIGVDACAGGAAAVAPLGRSRRGRGGGRGGVGRVAPVQWRGVASAAAVAGPVGVVAAAVVVGAVGDGGRHVRYVGGGDVVLGGAAGHRWRPRGGGWARTGRSRTRMSTATVNEGGERGLGKVEWARVLARLDLLMASSMVTFLLSLLSSLRFFSFFFSSTASFSFLFFPRHPKREREKGEERRG